MSNPAVGEIFRTRPERPWGSTSLLYNVYRVFPGGKAAETWRWPPTPSSVEVKERVELYLYSPSGLSWLILGWPLPLYIYMHTLLHSAWRWLLRTETCRCIVLKKKINTVVSDYISSLYSITVFRNDMNRSNLQAWVNNDKIKFRQCLLSFCPQQCSFHFALYKYIYSTVILPDVYVGAKLGLSHRGKNIRWQCSRTGCWGRYLGLCGQFIDQIRNY